MESVVQFSIYLHAFLGGVGLLTGAVSIVARKGARLHTRSGRVFSWSMIGSALLSLFIARMPGHENLFLFLIGVFTVYLVLAGNRALTLRYPRKEAADRLDKGISGAMFLTSAGMMAIGGYGLATDMPNSVLFVFFGGFGLLLSVGDFRNFRHFREDRKIYLKSHIGRLVGAMIASVTAFIVAGLNFSTVAAWITPTIVGTLYITYWTRRVRKRERPLADG